MADDGFSVVMEGRKFSQDCKQAGLGKAVGGRAKGDVAFPYLICHTKMTTPIWRALADLYAFRILSSVA